MANTYYAQSDHRSKTMTVGELIKKLSEFSPDELVIFKSPMYGSFGSNTAYSIDGVERVVLERREDHYPACIREDEETGKMESVEAWTQVFHAWSGIVIT